MSQETVSTVELEKAAQKIAQAKNLVTFSGAGLSAESGLRKCPQCGKYSNNYMRPSVVWFGEAPPDAVMQRAIDEASNADVLLVVGTSAAVY